MKITIRNKSLMILSLAFITLSAFAQTAYESQHGFALDADSIYLDSNPAALGFNYDYGLEYSVTTQETNVINQRVTASSPLGLLGWENDGTTNTLIYDYGLALFPDVFSLGYATAYDLDSGDMTDFNIGTQIRPLSFLSAGAVYGQTMGIDYAYAGLGFRPLALLDGWEHRLTFFGDFDLMDPAFLGAGVDLEPIDGLRLGALYDYNQNAWSGKLSLNLGTIGAGAWSNLEQVASSVKVSFLPQKSFLNYSPEKIVEIQGAQFFGEGPMPGLFSSVRSYKDFIEEIQGYTDDPTVKALVFVNQPMITSSAARIEIIEALQAFRAEGKKIYMHFDSLDLWGYAIAASVADHISLAKLGFLDVRHFSSTRLYFKNLLEEWGITVRNYHTGINKNAGNSFSEESMPLEVQQSLRTRLSLLQQAFVNLVSQGRGEKLTQDMESILAEGPYLYGEKARTKGLIDAASSETAFRNMLEEEYPGITWESYRPFALPETQWGPDLRDRIAVVYATGNIVYGPGQAGQSVGSESLIGLLDRLDEDRSIKAIVLRIDSPGGSALASDIMAEKITEIVDNGKPLVVSMGGVAASGGYYIAAPADYIFAGETTLTGSIGVVSLIPNLAGLRERFNVGATEVSTSDQQTFLNPVFPYTEKDDQIVQETLEVSYEAFIETVMAGRGLSEEEVRALAEGQVWTGKQALENGLVDELGGLDAAIAKAKELASLEEIVTEDFLVGPPARYFRPNWLWALSPQGTSQKQR
jgi:protease-4